MSASIRDRIRRLAWRDKLLLLLTGGLAILGIPGNYFRVRGLTGEAFQFWLLLTMILWAAPGGIDPATLVGYANIGDSITDASSTVLYDMTANARVAHFAEVDANELDHFDRQAVYLRPAQRLLGGHRYAVAIRKAVHVNGGGAPPITDGFQAVLDDRDTGHVLLDKARPRLREAVAALEAAGIPRDDLVVAWDFVIADDASVIADGVAARNAVLAAMGPNGVNLTYTITSDTGTLNADPRIARRIELDFEVPAVTGDGLAGYYRDANGAPMVQGTMTAHAYLMVPPCAASNNKAGLLLYGHGFFGSLEELRTSEYVRDIMSTNGCLIVGGTLWTGMSQDDIPNALLALNDLNKGWGFGERIFQGVVNTIALQILMRGKLATEVLKDASGSYVDMAHVFFLGISLGHILGSVYVAYEPVIEHAVLHVGAANWAMMFERSKNWSVYGVPLKGSYKDLLEADIMEQVLEMCMEGVDGAAVAGVQIPGTPQKSILMHTSLEDTQVPNLAGFYQARSLGLTLVTPSVVEPFGIDTKSGDLTRAYVIVDEHVTPLPPPDNSVFSYDNLAHENPRRRAALQQQMRVFWGTGMVQNTCGGACDCAAGACGPLLQPMYGGH